MNYDYQCSECNHTWEKSLLMKDRDLPCSEECPSCKKIGFVKRVITNCTLSYQGAKTTMQRAGWGWNDVLTKIKKGSGKKNTINVR